MSENELLIEREKLLGRLVEINWYFMAKKYLTTIAKRKQFLTILEKNITQETNASNVIFIEEDGDVYKRQTLHSPVIYVTYNQCCKQKIKPLQ